MATLTVRFQDILSSTNPILHALYNITTEERIFTDGTVMH